MLCSTFKGVLPSDLFEKYDCKGGWIKLDYDLEIALEISSRIKEQYDEKDNKMDAKKAVARRNQRRAESATVKPKDMGNMLKEWAGE